MKIVIYATKSTYSGKSFGGAERSLTLLAKKMGELGHEVALVTTSDSRRISRGSVRKESSFVVHFLPVFRLPLQRIGTLKKLNRMLNNVLWRKYMQKRFSDFDVAHGFSEYPDMDFILNWKKRFDLGIKVVIRAAHFFWVKANYRIDKLKPIIEGVYSEVDSVCFIQKKEKGDFASAAKTKFDITLKDSFVQDIGIEINNKLPAWTPTRNTFRVFMVARFSDDTKRQDLLIEAFKRLNIEDSELVFAGVGRRKEEYEQQCAKDQFLSTRVKFLGFVDREKLDSTLLSSSLFCLSSDSEGLCKSVLEAMSTGIPVLVSDVSVLNDYVIHDKNGLMADNTVEDWTAKLRYFYELSTEDQLKIGRTGKQFILDNYDSKVCAVKFSNELKRIVKLSD